MSMHRRVKRLLSPAFAAALAVVLAGLFPGRAAAFCGFFVSGAGGPLVNEATQVALMRDGMRTVLTMRNSYKGPPEDFALVIPVPVVLQQNQVRTLPTQVFDHLDQLTAPRLVEYWEEDPCRWEDESTVDEKEGGTGARAKGEEGRMGGARPAVRVEAEFAVDEYDVVILSADDALALGAWLRDNHYKVPAGVEPYLRPYVAAGSKFFVARVNVARVKFLWGRAVLSPLRFHYDTEVFSLPIRLGLANADGPQDLVVYVLARNGRYEVANYDNVFIPTNLEVRDEVRTIFPSFYATLFDRAVAGKPRAVVTEYAWDAGSCDPCPIPPLDAETIAQLGGDVLPSIAGGFVLTRLHARYGAETLGEDFVFRAVGAVSGGREEGGGREGGFRNTQKVAPASVNAFQGRYVIRHPWGGPVACDDPEFGVWGGPPGGSRPPPSMGMAPRLRRDAPLAELILDAAPTAADHPVAPSGVSARSQWAIFLARADHRVREAPWLPFAVAVAGAVAVLIAARRAGVAVLRRAGLFLILAAAPGALLLFHDGKHTVREAFHGDALVAVFQIAAALLVSLDAAAGKRPSRRPWLWTLVALVPVAAGLLDHRRALQATAFALPEAGSPDVYVRILAQGESEALQSIVLGAVGSAVLLWVAAFALAGHLARVAPPRGLVRSVAAVSLAWTALSAVALLHPAVPLERHWPRVPALLLILAAGGLAVRLARRLPAKDDLLARAAHAEVTLQSAGLVLLGAVAAAVACAARAKSEGLGAIAGESVDAYQVGRILSDTFAEVDRFAWRTPLLVVAGLAAFAPLWPRLRGSLGGPVHSGSAGAGDRGGPVRSTLALAGLAAATVAALALLYSTTQGALRALHLPIPGPDRLDAVAGLTPPDLSSASERTLGRSFTGPALLVDPQGRLLASPSTRRPPEPFGEALFRAMGEPSDDAGAEPEPLLLSHRQLPFGALLESLAPLLSRRQTTFRWVVGHGLAAVSAAQFGMYGDSFQHDTHRGTVAVEILSRVELRAATAEEAGRRNQRVVLQIRLGEARRPAQLLVGGLGRYRSLPGSGPFVLANGSDRGGGVRSVESALAGVREVLLVVPPAFDVGAVSLEMASILAGVRPSPGVPVPTFVLTSDPS